MLLRCFASAFVRAIGCLAAVLAVAVPLTARATKRRPFELAKRPVAAEHRRELLAQLNRDSTQFNLGMAASVNPLLAICKRAGIDIVGIERGSNDMLTHANLSAQIRKKAFYPAGELAVATATVEGSCLVRGEIDMGAWRDHGKPAYSDRGIWSTMTKQIESDAQLGSGGFTIDDYAFVDRRSNRLIGKFEWAAIHERYLDGPVWDEVRRYITQKGITERTYSDNLVTDANRFFLTRGPVDAAFADAFLSQPCYSAAQYVGRSIVNTDGILGQRIFATDDRVRNFIAVYAAAFSARLHGLIDVMEYHLNSTPSRPNQAFASYLLWAGRAEFEAQTALDTKDAAKVRLSGDEAIRFLERRVKVMDREADAFESVFALSLMAQAPTSVRRPEEFISRPLEWLSAEDEGVPARAVVRMLKRLYAREFWSDSARAQMMAGDGAQ